MKSGCSNHYKWFKPQFKSSFRIYVYFYRFGPVFSSVWTCIFIGLDAYFYRFGRVFLWFWKCQIKLYGFGNVQRNFQTLIFTLFKRISRLFFCFHALLSGKVSVAPLHCRLSAKCLLACDLKHIMRCK